MAKLFARDKKNKVRYWSVEVVDGCNVVRKYGQEGGKETVNEYTIEKGKAGRTVLEQAHLEAASLEKKQRDAGFSGNWEGEALVIEYGWYHKRFR